MPAVVRSDRGPEYRGAFDKYLREAGVEHRLISTMHPRANGIVERQVRSVKAGLRRFFAACPGGRWWEGLADVVRGLNVVPVRATGLSPYTVVFKTPPRLAVSAEVQLAAGSEQEEEPPAEEVTAAAGFWQLAFDELAARQQKYDAKMIREYARRARLADFDVRFLFKPGDRVLMKQKLVGKQRVRAMGPYIFVRYTGELRVTACIADTRGRMQVASVANLVPLRAGTVVAVDDPLLVEAEAGDYPQPPPASEISDDPDFGAGAARLDMRGEVVPRAPSESSEVTVSSASAEALSLPKSPAEASPAEEEAPENAGGPSGEAPAAAEEAGLPMEDASEEGAGEPEGEGSA